MVYTSQAPILFMNNFVRRLDNMAGIEPQALKVLRSKVHNNIQLGTNLTHEFAADFTDINPKFTGTFKVRRPSQLDRMQMGILKATLLNGNTNVDVLTENIATIVSTLEIVLLDRPEWFDIDNPDLEYEILEAVYVEYLKWDASFRRRADDSEHRGNSEDAGSKVPLVDTEGVQGTTN